MEDLSADKFITDVKAAIQDGYGFVPFVGAGFSAPSGVPLINELEEYLRKCICIALRLDEKGVQNRENHQPWNPQTDQWPPLVDRSLPKERGEWERVLHEKIVEQRPIVKKGGWLQKAKDSHLRNEARILVEKSSFSTETIPERRIRENKFFSELKLRADLDYKQAQDQRDAGLGWLKIYSEGFGAMQDWRSALLFLSRLEMPPRGDVPSPQCPTLGPPRPQVVDACFREVLKGRYPTLGHRMLGALAGAMRIDLVLTTNFDDLLEKAFETARNPIEVYEVLLDDSLPRQSEIESRRTLVKLHGGRVALRADYSLDESPEEEDRDRFLSYLLSPGGRHRYSADRKEIVNNPASGRLKDDYEFDKHILMLGFSAADKRINLLIKEALARLADGFHVYWVYFSPGDRETLEQEFYPHAEIQESRRRDRFRIVHCTSVGFLLLELYQSLRRTLPPLGSIFPSASRLTLPPITPKHLAAVIDRCPLCVDFRKRLEDQIWNRIEGSWTKVIVTCAELGSNGLTSVCADTFRSLETSSELITIWVDMNNVSSADNLYEVLLEAVYYRIGIEEWIPSTTASAMPQGPPFERRAREFARLLRTVDKKWVVFLNARERPGANTYEDNEIIGEWDRNGWLAHGIEDVDDNATPRSFIDLIVALCSEGTAEQESDSPGRGAPLTIVLMATGTEATVVQPGTWSSIKHERLSLGEGDRAERRPDDIAEGCMGWTGKGGPQQKSTRTRFLHALVLMQRPRFPAVIWSAAFFDDSAKQSPGTIVEDDSRRWLDELEKEGLVRRKPGGMVWVHSEVRGRLRETLKNDEETGDIHAAIAAWYEKAIDASDSPDAVFEAAYHFCKGAQALCRRDRPGCGFRRKSWGSKTLASQNPSDYSRAAALIQAATAKVSSEGYLIQTHGYSRGSCRQLAHLAKIGQNIWDEENIEQDACLTIDDAGAPERKKLREAISALWLACVGVMRAVAREVGEDEKAFYRQRQIAALSRHPKPATWSYCKSEGKLDKVRSHGFTSQVLARTKTDPKSRACAWRWMRWSVMLHIESRGYQEAEWILHGRKYVSGKKDHGDLIGSLPSQASYSRIVLEDRDGREAIELLRLLEKAVELQMLRFGVERRLGVLCSERLGYAEEMVRRGLKLAAKIRDSSPSFVAKGSEGASWCEMRLMMHLSVIHARACEVGFKPRLARDPLGILGDAEAKLRVSDAQRTRAELALIDLHRAEVKLYAEELKTLDHGLRSSMLAELPRAWRKDESNKNLVASLRRGGGVTLDAIRFLERAELVLRERRRNVWWTTWYFERKLKAISYAVMASCAEQGSPIPFLGLEAAMRETDTEADSLLGDALRMIRVDAYRMSAVVQAYADCLIALVTRLACDTTIPRLPLRINSMQAKLVGALAHVREIKEQRERGYQPWTSR